MKYDKMLEAAAKTFAGVKLGGKKSDPQLADLDRGVLTVGFLVAALDGTILPEEYAALNKLAQKCRGGSVKNVRALVDAALPTAGRLVTMAQVGVYSEKERLEAFLVAAKKALPRGFANGSLADLRRAFALWVAVGVADGVFSSIEKTAISALGWHYASVLAKSKKPKKGAVKAVRLLEADFMQKAEKIACDLASPAKKAKAEAALEALIASVPVVDGKGKKTLRPASGIAVKLLVMAMLGLAGAGSAKAVKLENVKMHTGRVDDDEVELMQTEVLNCFGGDQLEPFILKHPVDRATPKLQQFTSGKVSMTSDFFIKLDGIDGTGGESKWIEVMDFGFGGTSGRQVCSPFDGYFDEGEEGAGGEIKAGKMTWKVTPIKA